MYLLRSETLSLLWSWYLCMFVEGTETFQLWVWECEQAMCMCCVIVGKMKGPSTMSLSNYWSSFSFVGRSLGFRYCGYKNWMNTEQIRCHTGSEWVPKNLGTLPGILNLHFLIQNEYIIASNLIYQFYLYLQPSIFGIKPILFIPCAFHVVWGTYEFR